MRIEPGSIVLPSISYGASVTRRDICTGLSKRNSSSTHVVSSSDSVASSSSCVAVAQQRERAVADEVDRRLVAGDVEQHHLLDELVVAEAVAFVFGGDERAEQVVARVLALPHRSLRSCRR